MKRKLLLFSLFISFNVIAQSVKSHVILKDYFFPENLDSQKFVWPDLNVTEYIKYETDDKFIIEESQKIIPDFNNPIITYNRYLVGENQIINTFKGSNHSSSKIIREIVFNQIGLKWNIQLHPNEMHSYITQKGSTTTDYGNYPDCIVMTKRIFNNKIQDELYSKFYYAYKTGLVKVETWDVKTNKICKKFGVLKQLAE